MALLLRISCAPFLGFLWGEFVVSILSAVIYLAMMFSAAYVQKCGKRMLTVIGFFIAVIALLFYTNFFEVKIIALCMYTLTPVFTFFGSVFLRK